MTHELELLKRRLYREQKARRQAESIIEQKSRELYEANTQLTSYSNQLKMSNNDLEQFAHVVSHDLKSPLKRVKGLLDIMETELKYSSESSSNNYIPIIKDQIGKMEELITGILEYSQLDSSEIKVSTVDLKKLIAEIIHEMPQSDSFDIEVDESLPSIEANKIKIKQVFQNLISNAIKYHHLEKGNIKITSEEDFAFYTISVKDDGPGIHKDYQKQIFELFGTSPDNKEGKESTGIGLAIVKKIIETSGGKIWINSTLNEGSEFIFTWPK